MQRGSPEEPRPEGGGGARPSHTSRKGAGKEGPGLLSLGLGLPPLPSEGLPLCCPPAKVHTSPTTPPRGLSPSPTSRAGPLLPHRSDWGDRKGSWVWSLGLSQPRGTAGSQAGALPEEGEGPGCQVLRGHWLGWRFPSWCGNQALQGVRWGLHVQGGAGPAARD